MLWRIERVTSGIRVTFDPALLFAPDSDTLTARAEDNLRDLVKVLAWCHEVDILMNVGEDSTGAETNDSLSCKRIAAVSSFARKLGLKPVASPTANTASRRESSGTALQRK